MGINTVQRLDAAIQAAGIPIDGVSGSNAGNVRIDFKATATAPQKTAAAAIVSSFDFSQAADDTYIASQAKTAASASLDKGNTVAGNLQDRIVYALALVILDEINLLRSHAAINLAPRTAVQLVNAVKAKINATPQ